MITSPKSHLTVVPEPTAAPAIRSTALLIDLENVLGGYSDGLPHRVSELSLADIERQIRTAAGPDLGAYAVKRAYANWSNPILARLREDIIDLGIEPRQVFGFGDRGQKNAADIELVIDALELLYTQPTVTTFVVVSGDGGFASLVRRLHEFGKRSIAAGYPGRSGRALRAICDVFVELTPLPSLVAPETPAMAAPADSSAKRLIDIMRAAAGEAPTTPADTLDEMVRRAGAVMDAITAEPACLAQLQAEGLQLVQLSDVLKPFVSPQEWTLHFSGLTPFLKHVLHASEFGVQPGTAASPARVIQRPATVTELPTAI